ncbi:MAG: LCP family protein [Anaerolineaceae bacterium]
MKKRKTGLVIGIVLLVVALVSAAAALLWNNPLFGQSLDALNFHAKAGESSSNSGTAGGNALPSTSEEEGQNLPLESDQGIQAQLEQEHPELASQINAQDQNGGKNAADLCGGPEPMSVLILGIDDNEQADAIRLARLDFVEEEISLLSIPRDFWIPIVDMEAHNIKYGRINATYGYGEYYNGKGGGIVSLAANIQSNFGVGFDHYFILHFDDIAKYVDLIGGVDVTLKEAVEDGKLYFAAGEHHFDGETAVSFMRMREYDSDFYRVRRQSLIFTAIYQKAMDQLNLWQLVKLGVTVVTDKSISTDFAIKDVYALACLASRIKSENVAFIEIPSGMYHNMTTNKGAAVIVPHDTVPEFIQSVMDGSYQAE